MRPIAAPRRAPVRRYNLAVLRSLAACALLSSAVVSFSGCGSTHVVCVGMQCGPPYDLDVEFQPGTTDGAAQQLLASCTDHNPVVIRVGPLLDIAGGRMDAVIYTQVMGDTARIARLVTCLRHSSLRAIAGFPD
jgi:hypothetical protein